MILGLIEGRKIFRTEIVHLVMMRQHSMEKQNGGSYAGKEPARGRDRKKT
jgi:hypothetical protein